MKKMYNEVFWYIIASSRSNAAVLVRDSVNGGVGEPVRQVLFELIGAIRYRKI